MSGSILLSLIGRRITAADAVHDYAQLIFDNGDILNVFNKWHIEGGVEAGLRELAGQHVTEISALEEEVQIGVGPFVLKIDLSDAAYRGPEAIEYIPTTGSRVVWS